MTQIHLTPDQATTIDGMVEDFQRRTGKDTSCEAVVQDVIRLGLSAPKWDDWEDHGDVACVELIYGKTHIATITRYPLQPNRFNGFILGSPIAGDWCDITNAFDRLGWPAPPTPPTEEKGGQDRPTPKLMHMHTHNYGGVIEFCADLVPVRNGKRHFFGAGADDTHYTLEVDAAKFDKMVMERAATLMESAIRTGEIIADPDSLGMQHVRIVAPDYQGEVTPSPNAAERWPPAREWFASRAAGEQSAPPSDAEIRLAAATFAKQGE